MAGRCGARRMWSWVVGVLAVLACATATAQEPVRVRADDAVQALTPSQLYILEDPSAALGIADVVAEPWASRFAQAPSAAPNLGYSRSGWWLRFAVRNEAREARTLVMHIRYALFDDADLYVPDALRSYAVVRAGRAVPQAERAVPHNNPVFPLDLGPGEEVVLHLRVASPYSMTLPLQVGTLRAFAAADHLEQLMLGVLLGFIAIMILYNLAIFASTRDRTYLHYSLFVGVFLLYLTVENGMLNEVVLPWAPLWGRRLIPLLVFLTIVSSARLAQVLLHTREAVPRADRALMGFAALAVAGAACLPFIDFMTMSVSAVVLVIVYSPVLLLVAWWVWRGGDRSGAFFLAAWGFLVAGALVYGLKVLGVLPTNFWTTNGVAMGGVMQVVLLSLGLADKINALRGELVTVNSGLERLVEDRTASLQLSEHAYRELVEHAPAGICEIDLVRDQFISVNDVMCEYTGFERPELLQMSPRQLVAPGAQLVRPSSADPARGGPDGLAGGPGELPLKRRDGREIWVVPRSRVRSVDGHPTTATVVVHDITERKRAEQELVRAKEAAEAANRAKSSFLANMSHELRTPLNAIIGFSELLQAQHFGPLNQRQLEYVTEVVDSGRHLLRLITDILDISKIEAGRLALVRALAQPLEVLDAAFAAAAPMAATHGVSLTREVPDALPLASFDSTRLRQVVDNLLSNAVKFTGRGGGVTLRAHADDERLTIEVEDTGVGISPEDMPRLFIAFERLERTVDLAEGTGLGLALARRLVEMHGGEISVRSEVGRGSTFHVELPLEAPRAPDGSPPAEPLHDEDAAPGAGGGCESA